MQQSDLTKPNSEPGTPSRCAICAGGAHIPRLPATAFPGALEGSRIGSGALGAGIGTIWDAGVSRQQLNPLHHSIGPFGS